MVITKNKLLVDAKKGELSATSCKNRICMHPMRRLNLHALGAHLGGRARRDIYYIIPIFYLGSALLHATSDDEMKKEKKGGLCLKFLLFSDTYIGFKLYKRLPNYHPRGDLISHLYF